jgi:formate hydrogenlyase subunit 6/NADH:ubiquinone oxidoreductase subunit I
MLKTALKNMFRKPVTRLISKTPEGLYRGIHKYEKEKCIYCGACERVCPSQAIKVDREKKVWELDLGKCLFCGECERVCPVKCLHLTNKVPKPALKHEEMILR